MRRRPVTPHLRDFRHAVKRVCALHRHHGLDEDTNFTPSIPENVVMMLIIIKRNCLMNEQAQDVGLSNR